MTPTPTAPDRAYRPADFATITEALDFAATGVTGVNLYSQRGELVEVLPYREMREQAIALARRLLASGLKSGDRVGVVAETDGDFIRTFFACQYAGIVPAPLPLPAPFGGRQGYIEHVRRMLQSADAKAVFAPSALADWMAEAAEGLTLSFAGCIADLDEGGGELPEPPGADPDGLCYLQFSSGSTRFPLGVAVTHKALMANVFAIGNHGLKVAPADRAVSWLPLYHDMGLIGFFLSPMACQVSLDLLPTAAFVRRPLLWLDLISKYGGSISYSPTFGYELCTRRAETMSLDGFDLSTWRAAGIGGDMIRPPVLNAFAERFAGAGFDASAFVASYGMAEATLALSFAPLDQGLRAEALDVDRLERDQVAAKPNGKACRVRDFALCGPALPGHELKVRGVDGADLPERKVGRIYARGPSLMQAYFRQPEETGRVLSDDGWLDTGDLGYVAGGEIVITGRAKDLIIVNGRNVWPQDLEWTAEAEAPILRSGDVAVFSVPGEGEETVVALVQCRMSDPDAREKLRADIAGCLRLRHGVETAVVLTAPHALPKTSSGKLSRTRAKAMYQAGAFTKDAAAVTA
jgi:fatty-acyl-CoA synthase